MIEHQIEIQTNDGKMNTFITHPEEDGPFPVVLFLMDAHKIQGEMYFGCAETDEYAPPEMIDSLDAHLKSTGINYRIETYPGTEHGFTFPRRTGKYHKPSAERQWERLLAMFHRNLQAKSKV